MSFARTQKRNKIKEHNGNNKIRKLWEASQIHRYGFRNWWDMRVNCDSKGRRARTLVR